MGSKPRHPLNGVTNNVANVEEKFSRMNVQEVRDTFQGAGSLTNRRRSGMKTGPIQVPAAQAVHSRLNDESNLVNKMEFPQTVKSSI